VLELGLREFLSSCARLLKRAKKPGKAELWLLIRVCALGIIVVGAVGFAIRILGFLLLPRG